MLLIYKKTDESSTHQFIQLKWGGRWDSNPRMTGPQPAVLTASPQPPSISGTIIIIYDEMMFVKSFFKKI